MIKKIVDKFKEAREKKKQRKIDEKEIARFESEEAGVGSFPNWIRTEVIRLDKVIEMARINNFNPYETAKIKRKLDDLVLTVEHIRLRIKLYEKAYARKHDG